MSNNLIPGDTTIKAIKPGDPRARLSDGQGLYLLLFVKAARTAGASTTALAAGARRCRWAPIPTRR